MRDRDPPHIQRLNRSALGPAVSSYRPEMAYIAFSPRQLAKTEKMRLSGQSADIPSPSGDVSPLTAVMAHRPIRGVRSTAAASFAGLGGINEGKLICEQAKAWHSDHYMRHR